MAKKANAKLIGGFVAGAIVLVIVGALAFGGAQFFAKKRAAVLFFQGSLSGVDKGSPVTFRGVKIGTVTNVSILYDVTKAVLRIPVHIEIDLEKVQIVSGQRNERNIKTLVERGLRAQLQSVSLVTGQTAVDFDFRQMLIHAGPVRFAVRGLKHTCAPPSAICRPSIAVLAQIAYRRVRGPVVGMALALPVEDDELVGMERSLVVLSEGREDKGGRMVGDPVVL